LGAIATSKPLQVFVVSFDWPVHLRIDNFRSYGLGMPIVGEAGSYHRLRPSLSSMTVMADEYESRCLSLSAAGNGRGSSAIVGDSGIAVMVLAAF